jgi:hypothetical protein
MEKLQPSAIPFEANMNVCSDFDIHFLQLRNIEWLCAAISTGVIMEYAEGVLRLFK